MTDQLILQLTELGEDADLLVRHDDWLENQRKAAASELDRNANQLRAVLLAQRIKLALQQKNLVAVQELVRNTKGEVVDIAIKIMSLPDALQRLLKTRDTLDEVNAAGQVYGWDIDGYDIPTSRELREAV
jgi:hypothetical protein